MSSRESHDAFHPERLNDDRLWGMYQIEVQNMELWQGRAERSLQELYDRGLLTEPVQD
jgi:pyridoxine/pyridoxamine 5'-phosphate oxidase